MSLDSKCNLKPSIYLSLSIYSDFTFNRSHKGVEAENCSPINNHVSKLYIPPANQRSHSLLTDRQFNTCNNLGEVPPKFNIWSRPTLLTPSKDSPHGALGTCSKACSHGSEGGLAGRWAACSQQDLQRGLYTNLQSVPPPSP